MVYIILICLVLGIIFFKRDICFLIGDMLFVLVVKFLGFFIDFINLVDIGFVIVVNKIGVFVDIVVND